MQSLQERFWNKVARSSPSDCWEWQGARQTMGYGAFSINGKPEATHRLAWEMANGPIPDGLHVCHHCDNPPCVNPAHLFLGTPAANAADKVSKGRASGGARGSRNNRAKLNEWSACGVMARCLQGVPQVQVSREFGVTRQVVYCIVKGKVWKHLFTMEK